MSKAKDDEVVTVKMLRSLLLETIGEKIDTRLDKIEEKLTNLGNFGSEIEVQKEIIKKQEKRIDGAEMYLRLQNIVFYGIPKQDDENPLEVAVDIARELGISLNFTDIDTAHRLRLKNMSAALCSSYA